MEKTFTKKQYKEYMSSLEWHSKRLLVARKHKYTCDRCKKICRYTTSLKGFEVHHKTYKNFMHEKYEDLSFLCIRCHRIIHKFKYQKRTK